MLKDGYVVRDDTDHGGVEHGDLNLNRSLYIPSSLRSTVRHFTKPCRDCLFVNGAPRECHGAKAD